jgi:hypothetical protein
MHKICFVQDTRRAMTESCDVRATQCCGRAVEMIAIREDRCMNVR